MKNSLFIFFLCLFNTICYSQKILTVDFTKIKARIENKNSSFYYPDLLQRFEKGDSTINQEEAEAIYYGSVFQKNYSPYTMGYINPAFLDLYNSQKYREALPLGLKSLEDNPINLKLTFKILVCYHELGITDSSKLFARRYFSLLNVIYNSGEGTSIDKAMVVVCVSDEYEILKDAELEMTSQALIGSTDKLILKQDSQKQTPKIPALYFNVETSLNTLGVDKEK